MKVTVVCVNSEKRLMRRSANSPVKEPKYIHRAQFEAVPVDDAPENKAAWDSTPALSLDIPNVNEGFEVGKTYTVEIKAK